jgi:hypothetical protein
MRKELVTAMSEALYWRKQYDDSNPDVGMGPSLDSLLGYIIDRTDLTLTVTEKAAILQNVEQQTRN